MPSTNCPTFVATGQCSSVGCRYNHSILTCDPCGFLAADTNAYQLHVRSHRHRLTLSGQKTQTQLVQCPLCTSNVPDWGLHVKGKKHLKRAKKMGVSPDVTPVQAAATLEFAFCELCNLQVDHDMLAKHTQSRRHKGRQRFMQYRAVLDEAEKDKNGLVVEGGQDLGYLDPASTEGKLSFRINIKHTGPGKSTLREANLLSQHGRRATASGFTVKSATINTTLTSAHAGHVDLAFQNNFIGRYEDRLELIFEDIHSKKRFMISRPLQVVVGNKAEHSALLPKIPYTPRPKTARRVVEQVVPGVAPSARRNAIPYVRPLPKAPPPAQLLEILNGSDPVRKQVDDVKSVHLPPDLSSYTYAQHFGTLLWVEEHKTEADLERYDMSAVSLEKSGRYYNLGIPGLAEKRPSVLIGDRILVQKINAPTGHWFEGHVHIVQRDQVALCFHTSFTGWTPSQRYNIHFQLNRIVVQRQHQALNSAFKEDRVLFPLQQHVNTTPKGRRKFPYFNSLIPGNERQARAVRSIVKLPSGSPPFIVFGPPGTGKTITIVEAMRQLLQKNPQTRILACAPSNSAADLIAERLCGALGTDALFRMYAPSRTKAQMPDALRNHVFINPDGYFSVPSMETMKSFRVIVATCVAASMVSGIGMTRGHFSHIFIDEAGQATEPEAIISINTMADPSTNIVLSGDPKQLGPIIRSPISSTLGLATSYLERLMESDIYEVSSASATVVKLIKNYRSHPAILKFPNEQFYAGDLEAWASAATINAFLNSPLLPKNPKFPVVFHAVAGKDDREASSPSFFNVDEVLQVKSYVQTLMEGSKFRAADKEIGVITPYHAQCLKVRSVLRSFAPDVKVGSVEEFQGQERKVIIISTVRSSKDFVEYDLRHTLGFVANPRRFNVAVTRAQALLIVVGNPHVLGLDPLWRSFLNYIHANQGWTGSMDIPWDPEDSDHDDLPYDARARRQAEVDMNDFTRRMEELALGTLKMGRTKRTLMSTALGETSSRIIEIVLCICSCYAFFTLEPHRSFLETQLSRPQKQRD